MSHRNGLSSVVVDALLWTGVTSGVEPRPADQRRPPSASVQDKRLSINNDANNTIRSGRAPLRRAVVVPRCLVPSLLLLLLLLVLLPLVPSPRRGVSAKFTSLVLTPRLDAVSVNWIRGRHRLRCRCSCSRCRCGGRSSSGRR